MFDIRRLCVFVAVAAGSIIFAEARGQGPGAPAADATPMAPPEKTPSGLQRTDKALIVHEGAPVSPERNAAKPRQVHVLMNRQGDGRCMSFFGDMHPSYFGNVVKPMASARQGFRWWEIDLTYYVLRGLAALGVIWDLREPPAAALEGRARAAAAAAEPRA